MSDWQPIETAPIGKEILATGDPDWPRRVAIGFFYKDKDGKRLHFKWNVDDSNDMFGTPIHWMPLPEPPQ